MDSVARRAHGVVNEVPHKHPQGWRVNCVSWIAETKEEPCSPVEGKTFLMYCTGRPGRSDLVVKARKIKETSKDAISVEQDAKPLEFGG